MFHPQGPTFFELARQALSSTERGYDLLAPKFDVTPFRTPDAVLEAAGREIALLGPYEDALDVCCGTGAAMPILRALCRGRVVGVDFSQGMLREASRQLGVAVGSRSFELVRADALALPFTGAFDLATCFGALGHVLPADQPRFVHSVKQCLRPGGLFVLATSPRPRPWTRRYWFVRAFDALMRVRNAVHAPPFIMYYGIFFLGRAERLLREAGFSVDVRGEIFPERYRELRLVIGRRER